MTPGDVMKLMDRLGKPPLGPCAFCGHPDARHRVADEVVSRTKAGDPLDLVLAEFGFPPPDGQVPGNGTVVEFLHELDAKRRRGR